MENIPCMIGSIISLMTILDSRRHALCKNKSTPNICDSKYKQKQKESRDKLLLLNIVCF